MRVSLRHLSRWLPRAEPQARVVAQAVGAGRRINSSTRNVPGQKRLLPDRSLVVMLSSKTPPERGLTMWEGYQSQGCWDELLLDGRPRHACDGVVRYLMSLGGELAGRQEAAELAIRSMGITFTVYTEASNIDQAWLFDVIPRVVSTQEWERISRGLVQRLTALNLFIDDVYGAARVVADGVFPAELLSSSLNFRPQCRAARPRQGIWAHICGSDLVRDADGTMYVLEDNLRVPSGVSYMLENRLVTKRVFADLFRDLDIQPVDGYTTKLASLLAGLSPRPGETPVIVVLTPGIFNSAYFEHAFLAQQMGTHLVEGKDLLVVGDDCVYMRTIGGLVRVDVIYRRVDDLFLDPEVFRPDSIWASPGSCGPGGPATSQSPTRRGQEWPTTRSSMPMCPR